MTPLEWFFFWSQFGAAPSLTEVDAVIRADARQTVLKAIPFPSVTRADAHSTICRVTQDE